MRRYTDTERQRIVRNFQESGLSAAAFCRRRGVSTVTLAQWRKRWLRNPDSAAPAPAPPAPWLPVVLSDPGRPLSAPPPGAVIYRLVRGDLRLEVSEGYSLSEVRELWQLVAGGMPGSSSMC